MSEEINASLPEDPDRRAFLQAGAAGAAGLVTAVLQAPAEAGGLPLTNTGADQIPRKPFGRTGQQVSIIGIGGYSLGQASTLPEATRIVHEAIDAGINFF